MNSLVLAVFAAALTAVVLVAVSVFRAGGEPKRFPWFWVAFPVTCFSLVGLVTLVVGAAGTSDYGWTMYSPLTDAPGTQFLSNEQFSQLQWAAYSDVAVWILALVGVIGGGIGAVIAWRRGRI